MPPAARAQTSCTRQETKSKIAYISPPSCLGDGHVRPATTYSTSASVRSLTTVAAVGYVVEHGRRARRGLPTRAGVGTVVRAEVLKMFPTHRPRRLRTTPAMRRLVAETDLRPRQLVLPMFVREGIDEPVPVSVHAGRRAAHPRDAAQGGHRGGRRGRRRADALRRARPSATPPAARASIRTASSTSALRDVRAEVGDAVVVMADLCLDEFTDHGHCGVLDARGGVDNDATLARLRRDGRRAGRGGRPPARAERHDGRPGRRDPPGARRRGPPGRRPARLHRQVRVGVLRPVPRGRRLAAARRPQDLPAGPGERPRGAARARARPRGGRRHRHGQARA